MPDAAPPFAPAPATFACPALLALAARASLGGAREALLGAVMALRLASGLLSPSAVPAEARSGRAESARAWLGALTLPAKTRATLLRAFAASADNNPATTADAITAVMDITAPFLDRNARLEFVRIADGLRAESLALAGSRDRPIE